MGDWVRLWARSGAESQQDLGNRNVNDPTEVRKG